jgi:CAF1 family ribonuclease
MFPPADLKTTREVVLNPSSIAFLNEHNMNFDVWTKQGVPFVISDQAEELIKLYQTKQLEIRENKEKKRSNSYRAGRRNVELRKTEDIDFHARAMASLREWLDSAQPMHVRGRLGANENVPEGLSFLLPAANSFMRRVFYER